MTTFEQRGTDASGQGAYRMYTHLSLDAADSLRAIGQVEGHNLTEGVRRVVSMNKWYDDCRAAGSVVLAAQEGDIEPVAPPPLVGTTALTVGDCRPLTLNINAPVHDYLQPKTDAKDADDLVPFWGSAISFYGAVNERLLLRHRFFIIRPEGSKPELSTREVLFNDPFAAPTVATEPPVSSVRAFLRRLLS